MNEFVEQFLLESRDLVEQATADLLALEENPGDTEHLDNAFRAFHTLKGSAAIVEFSAMVTVSHAAEDTLAAIRSGAIKLSRGLISNSLSCLDLIVQWLDAMQLDGEIPVGADEKAQAILALFKAGNENPAHPDSALNVSGVAAKTLPENAILVLGAQCVLLSETHHDRLVSTLLSASRVVVNVLRCTGHTGAIPSIERAAGEAAASENAAQLIAAIEELLNPPRTETSIAVPAQDTTARVLRVDVERIDALVKLTGELTVAKNAIGHAVWLAEEGVDRAELVKLLADQRAQIGHLVEELQRSVLGIRVLPLRQVFNRFPRLVREIAEQLGKSVRLVMEGEATEADKVVVENLFEPVLHIVRNALDHGIESPDQRESAGKERTATIVLRASRTADIVLVEVADDGRGVDVAKVRRLAAERKLFDPATVAAMSDEEAVELIFASGFSTAEEVTDLSGRGVGMDVVRRSVERLGGTSHIASTPGSGTTVRLRMPFSVMMTRLMTVEAGGQMFGIPLDSIIETVRVPRDQISTIGAGRAFVLRDRTVPLIDLGQALGRPLRGEGNADTNIVVVSLGGLIGSVEIDRFGDRLDVMLRPMEGLLKGMPGVAGTSLLGDGRILIVLDLPSLLQ